MIRINCDRCQKEIEVGQHFTFLISFGDNTVRNEICGECYNAFVQQFMGINVQEALKEVNGESTAEEIEAPQGTEDGTVVEFKDGSKGGTGRKQRGNTSKGKREKEVKSDADLGDDRSSDG